MLSEAMNTYNPALSILKEKGYSIQIIFEDEDEDVFTWKATKEKNVISAFNPLSLLALVIVYEEYGEDWKQYNSIDLYDQILESSLDDKDLNK